MFASFDKITNITSQCRKKEVAYHACLSIAPLHFFGICFY